jgi:short-subunit dehydrogenase
MLASQGATLCLVGRTLEKLEATAAEAQTPCHIFPCDLTIDSQVRQLKGELESKFGQLDILIHSAGIISKGTVESAPVTSLDEQYAANVHAPYLLTQALLPLLKIRPGQIAFVNSSVGLRATAGVSQYAATKHSIKAIADSLREEVNPLGVRVLSIFPGRTATPVQEALYRQEGAKYQPDLLLQAGDVAAIVIAALKLAPTAEVTEISIRPLMKSY